jgi:hypothetical protein
MIKRVACVLCLLFFTTQWAHATSVERLGLEDLTKKARAIVVGRVTGSRTYWSPGRKFILTDYTIAVAENVKGRAASTISVTTVGGRIGDVELYVSGMPFFERGENAVIFIEQSAAYQTVVGLRQGKFTITNGEVANSVDGLSFPDGRPGNPLKMSLETFKTRIRSFNSQ